MPNGNSCERNRIMVGKIAQAREDVPGMTDDEYMLEEYADDHDEYLVDGAGLGYLWEDILNIPLKR